MSTWIPIPAHQATSPGRAGAATLALRQRLRREHDPKPGQSTYAPVVPPQEGENHTIRTDFPGRIDETGPAGPGRLDEQNTAPAEVRPASSVPFMGLESFFPSATQVPGTG